MGRVSLPLPFGMWTRLTGGARYVQEQWSRVVVGNRVLLLDARSRIADLFSLDDEIFPARMPLASEFNRVA